MEPTTWLGKFEKFNVRLSRWFEWIGIIGLVAMMLVTVIDVVGGKLFTWRLLGAIDIVTLSQLVAIAFAASATLIIGRHITVDFFFRKLPRRVQAVIDTIINLLILCLFSLIVWRLTVLGYRFQISGESTATVYIPLYPFAYGIALASIPVFLVILTDLIKSSIRVVKR